MSTQSKSTTRAGIGFPGLLFIVFLTLKLTSVIEWSWWWITAPIWAPVAIYLGAFLVVLIGEIAKK